MREWTSFDDKYPDKFPCLGRNYNLHIQDIIMGIDNHTRKRVNKIMNYCVFCHSDSCIHVIQSWQNIAGMQNMRPGKPAPMSLYFDTISPPFSPPSCGLIVGSGNIVTVSGAKKKTNKLLLLLR